MEIEEAFRVLQDAGADTKVAFNVIRLPGAGPGCPVVLMSPEFCNEYAEQLFNILWKATPSGITERLYKLLNDKYRERK